MNDKNPNIMRLFDFLTIPVKLAWNILLTVTAIGLTIAWLCFVLPSVVGIILLAVFWPDGFVWPMALCYGCARLWPGRSGSGGPLYQGPRKSHDKGHATDKGHPAANGHPTDKAGEPNVYDNENGGVDIIYEPRG